MGRKPSKPNAIPRLRLRARGKKTFYYYDHGGKPRRETPLGSDYGLAIKRWAEDDARLSMASLPAIAASACRKSPTPSA